MSDQITYDNKVDLQVATNIANINKVTASDMNEIKDVVNGNAEDVGDISTLTTTNKTSVVNAINELETDKLETSAIVNEPSTETDEVYSSGYLNDKLVSVGTTAPTDGRRVWFKNSRNLIEPLMATATLNGVTCTNNGDGSFTLNGTATANATFRLDQSTYNGTNNLKTYNGTYTLSCNELENGLDLRVMQNSTWVSVLVMMNSNTPVTATTDKDNCFIYISIASGKSLNNLTIRPMLQKGSVATGFEPYVNPSINVDGEKMYYDNYSTSEKVIGKWVDGRNLYRKVITITSINTNANVTDVSISLPNLNEIVNIGGSVKTSSGQYKPVTTYYTDSTGLVQKYGFCIYAISSSLMTLSYGDWWKGGIFNGCKVIIEYTKTTD